MSSQQDDEQEKWREGRGGVKGWWRRMECGCMNFLAIVSHDGGADGDDGEGDAEKKKKKAPFYCHRHHLCVGSFQSMMMMIDFLALDDDDDDDDDDVVVVCVCSVYPSFFFR